ncbi:ribose-phosphate pyrophosphokinase [Alteromonas pelagimontana]|uniref:Ribose-phosphate pyrophosphokinase n=1 Tax=Alteromonas pelagimontana TaxID=1858656 RepID=A0A6M4MA49_9ALTE|nr:hypothetical protein [Alteromonas pelagimontana]QJR79698.1 ribose-phosphate pyrophosphokinase [Alteromonas pelagimontana]
MMTRMMLTAVLGGYCVTGCAQQERHQVSAEQSQQNTLVEVKKENTVKKTSSMKGTIVYKSMEGGFYAFISDSGEHFTLQGLTAEYRKNGLKVAVKGIPLKDVMTFTQFGTVFKVSEITVLDDSQVKPINQVR